MLQKSEKILVALSGGVDSAVVLSLLKKQGYEVTAAFMKNFSESVNLKSECPWKEDKIMAYRVAAHLGVNIQTFDFEKQYHDKVVKYIFDSYQTGLTPNPDILCNNEIKFKLFLEKALSLGFDKIATGHYAQIKHDKNGYHLLRGKDKNKDQSYFLSGLTQHQLAKSLFPIGHLDKLKVRKMAKQAKLPNATRPDSQGICFIGKIDLKTWLSQKIKPKAGEIVDTNSKKLGTHQGVWYYTIGQRQGLGLAGGPWYIVSKDLVKNQIMVAKTDDQKLFKNNIQISKLHWLGREYKLPLKAKAQIRYRQPGQAVLIRSFQVPNVVKGRGNPTNLVRAEFKKPQKGVAAGQTLVIYKGNELIASGNII